MNPIARRDDLETQQVDGELVVYDLRNDHAHCLRPLAVKVWELADGSRSVEGIASILSEDIDGDAEDTVWQALDSLAEADLLEERLAPPTGGGGLTRRELVRDLATVGALGALTIGVRSIIAPAPLQAQSGGTVTDPQIELKQKECEGLSKIPDPSVLPQLQQCLDELAELEAKAGL